MSGSGLGTFTYAYLTNYLILQYDWRGTILILSGILLNGVVCGVLFRPLYGCSNGKSDSSDSSISTSNTHDINNIEERERLINEKMFNSLTPKYNFNPPKSVNMPARLTMSTDLVRVQKDLAAAELCDVREFSSQRDCRDVRHRQRSHNQMAKRDIFYSGSLTHLHGNQNSRLFSSHVFEIESITPITTEESQRCGAGIKEVVRSHCAMFKDKIFFLLLLTNVCWTGNRNFIGLVCSP